MFLTHKNKENIVIGLERTSTLRNKSVFPISAVPFLAWRTSTPYLVQKYGVLRTKIPALQNTWSLIGSYKLHLIYIGTRNKLIIDDNIVRIAQMPSKELTMIVWGMDMIRLGVWMSSSQWRKKGRWHWEIFLLLRSLPYYSNNDIHCWSTPGH